MQVALDISYALTGCHGALNTAGTHTGSQGVLDTTNEPTGSQDSLNMAAVSTRCQPYLILVMHAQAPGCTCERSTLYG